MLLFLLPLLKKRSSRESTAICRAVTVDVDVDVDVDVLPMCDVPLDENDLVVNDKAFAKGICLETKDGKANTTTII